MVKQTRGYRVWDPTSEDALKAGVRKHGLGAWEHIRKDPQFAILSDRTGVQLKDKWRNLVKFRHIDPDEQRTYKPKTQGPWSKKYKRDRTQGLSGTASPVSDDGGGASEDELEHHAADPQALRQSGRTNPQKRKAISDMAIFLEGDGAEVYTASEDDERGGMATPAGGGGAIIVGSSAAIDVPLPGDGAALGSGAVEGEVGMKRSRPRSLGRASLGRSSGSRHRKAMEDRRFGIYDRRRYGFAEDGLGLRGRSCDGDGSGDASESDGAGLAGGSGGVDGGGANPGGAVQSRVRRRGGAGRRGGGRGGSDDEDDEDPNTEDSDSDGGAAMEEIGGGAVGGGGRVRGAADSAMEEYVISCPCGVTYDDGEMMIECESCAAWAHVACLRQQMLTAPERFNYNFTTYHCSGCQAALHSLQQGPSAHRTACLQSDAMGGGAGDLEAAGCVPAGAGMVSSRKSDPSVLVGIGSPSHRNGVLNGGTEDVGRALVVQDRAEQRDADADGDTASEDSQRKASELSNILLGLANGRLGSSSGAARRGGGGGGGGGSNGGPANSGSFSKFGSLARSSAPQGTAAAAGHRAAAATNGGGSPMTRSGSMGHTNSSGLGAAAAASAAAVTAELEAALAREGGGNRMMKSGLSAVGEGLRRAAAGGSSAGPVSSSGGRGGLEGAGSPPPLLDGGLPLFQGSGPGSAVAGSFGAKIFKPVPKLATAGSGLPGNQPQQHRLLSAPKARPHPALQRDASQHSLQRMMEVANPNAAAAAAAAAGGAGGGGAGGGPGVTGASVGGRGIPLTSVLEAAGSLHVAAANLCAATGRKTSAAAAGGASVSTGGPAIAADGGGSCDAVAGSSGAAASGGGTMPPRPPSSMAREVANRIFGESDDDDAGGVIRPLSALRGGDPWFLMPPSLSRAATPSTFFDSILRVTPDIIPLPGSSPPPNLAAALAVIRSESPAGAYLPALLAQQYQHHAAIQQFMSQSTMPMAAPSAAASALQATATAAPSTAGATSVLLPPPHLARPTPLPAPPPPLAPPPPPLAIGGSGGPSAWPPGAPPPPPLPPPLHQPSSNGEPVTLHPVLRHLLLSAAHQQQHLRSAEGTGSQQQQQQQCAASGPTTIPGADGAAAQMKDEAGPMPPPPPPQQQHLHQSQALQQQQQHHNSSQDTSGREIAASGSGGGGGGDSTSGGATGLVVQPLGPPTAALPSAGSSGGGLTAPGHLRDVAMAAAVAAAAIAGGHTTAAAVPPPLTSFDSSGSSVAALLGLGVGGLHLNVLDHLRRQGAAL